VSYLYLRPMTSIARPIRRAMGIPQHIGYLLTEIGEQLPRDLRDPYAIV
jgi:hypothetical protein